MTKISIIGGGIGGLSTAIALQKAGFETTIYESAPEITAAGSGIMMANNAMQVFREWNLDQKVAEKGNRITAMQISDSQLKALTTLPLQSFEQKYGLSNYAIHRADLHSILAEEIGHQNLKLNKQLQEIQRVNTGFELQFSDGTTVLSDYVIAADGIKSFVRKKYFNQDILRNAQQDCWRGILSYQLPEKCQQIALEAWAPGARFGFVQLKNEQVYWYMLRTKNSSETINIENTARLFHPLAQELVSKTASEKIIETPIFDLKPMKTWHLQHICLLGDAAHATTPNLGQGACQAIEDAYVIGKIAKQKGIKEAIQTFSNYRIKKAHRIVRESWMLGKIAQWNNKIAIGFRNTAMKAAPTKLSLQQLEWIFKLDDVK